jgi:ATP-dependent protease HslVU (ClpYQ) peptidase subunit
VTTILGKQYKKGYVLAADSQVTVDDTPFTHGDILKIVTNGEYHIAGAGNARYCDVAAYDFVPPTYDGSELYKFMVTKFVPALREAHEKTGYTLKDDETFTFLIGVANRLFQICDDYTVLCASHGLYGIGSGGPFGLGAMYAGMTPEMAVSIAAKFDINTGGKTQVVRKGVNNG